jgi:hypothetical protein
MLVAISLLFRSPVFPLVAGTATKGKGEQSKKERSSKQKHGGNDRFRTCDPRLAKAMLYQLSYVPLFLHPPRWPLLLEQREGFVPTPSSPS